MIGEADGSLTLQFATRIFTAFISKFMERTFLTVENNITFFYFNALMTKKLSRTVVNIKGGCVTHLLLGKIPLRHQKLLKKEKKSMEPY